MLGSEIIDELSTANLAFRFPDQESAYWVFPKNGVKQATGLLFAPDKWPLNVWQPEAAIFVGIV
jgi:hypothetical protein